MWCIIINIHVPFSEYTHIHIYQLSSTSIFFNVIFASVINMCAQEYIMVTEQMFENYTKMLYEFYFFFWIFVRMKSDCWKRLRGVDPARRFYRSFAKRVGVKYYERTLQIVLLFNVNIYIYEFLVLTSFLQYDK